MTDLIMGDIDVIYLDKSNMVDPSSTGSNGKAANHDGINRTTSYLNGPYHEPLHRSDR